MTRCRGRKSRQWIRRRCRETTATSVSEVGTSTSIPSASMTRPIAERKPVVEAAGIK
jgi:hypothetical protein